MQHEYFTVIFTVCIRLEMVSNASQGKGLPLPHGAYSRIARRLRPKVTPQHVREVALGLRKSARVERAIENYRAALARREGLRSEASEGPPLSQAA